MIEMFLRLEQTNGLRALLDLKSAAIVYAHAFPSRCSVELDTRSYKRLNILGIPILAGRYIYTSGYVFTRFADQRAPDQFVLTDFARYYKCVKEWLQQEAP